MLWHEHNLRRKSHQLPSITAEECLANIDVGDSKLDLKEYSFRVRPPDFSLLVRFAVNICRTITLTGNFFSILLFTTSRNLIYLYDIASQNSLWGNFGFRSSTEWITWIRLPKITAVEEGYRNIES
ncbi:hypothetical protein Vadar_012845 [Vaccinium darrowii]|uniref:Uncharacterized protein n=1 Tax=Vaccinium darrowii TaxID=229202 RepID=A0ACB7YEC5_9ERIC|nr:hypothetical protein Vadar_012845 [Vaccinium darrowii]